MYSLVKITGKKITIPNFCSGFVTRFNVHCLYRSHKSILEVSSRLFYGGKLEPYADQQMVSRMLVWDRFQAKHASAPMLFAAVEGKHEHEIDSPSFFNKAEIVKVVEICQYLVQTGLVTTSQIGVIAAFR